MMSQSDSCDATSISPTRVAFQFFRKISTSLRSFFTALVVTSFLSGGVAAIADWPQWRGPDRDGSFNGPEWPKSLSSLTLKWKQPIDDGYPGPIISGSKVITVETLRKSNEVVRCFDRKTGEQIWSAQWEGAMRVPFFAARNGSWVRSTPATDGKSVFVAGMRDVLVSLDLNNGTENWRVDFVQRFETPIPSFGKLSRHVQIKNLLQLF